MSGRPHFKSLHKNIAYVIFAAQVFGYFPVSYIFSSVGSLRFTVWSWRVLYCTLTFFGGLFVSVIQVQKVFDKGINIFEADTLLYRLFGCIISIIFFKLAMEWPDFMKEWHKVDGYMKNESKLHLHRFLILFSLYSLGKL